MTSETYTPRTWRTHPLHLVPPEPYSPSHPGTKATLDWIFFVSSLNFSFWSEKEGSPERYGVEWREGWGSEKTSVWTGYWSLLASINRALEAGIPITDPSFYSSEALCPDKLIEDVFRHAPQSKESIPLLRDRIKILREVGSILCKEFRGSFQGFLESFHRKYKYHGTALQLVQMVAETFPSFRDETTYEGRRVYFWKRPQILVAETWAAFYPPPCSSPTIHPLFRHGAFIHELTMFADYRVPQILHHLRILSYPSSLIDILLSHKPLPTGCREEVAIRAASILAVEQVRKEIERLRSRKKTNMPKNGLEKCVSVEGEWDEVSSVVIDFYLWDLAKKIEVGDEKVDGIRTVEMLPAHRTRSIWY
ncbi:hypothetical protein JAAARDRAFT_30512 [Jaapia argillacea MUCL 33604]|uniref:Queuosine 5'-phosphate N-glycosylase/hydrolase n=1 Tax=Jaapia argillacea MUCL 33604 TaxID=933084 RepID=A0A067Q6K3_9AGAM|nr:hypothetical protein JAAARDRAFT_30512 [Jaapia argillacea MUCL 33604]